MLKKSLMILALICMAMPVLADAPARELEWTDLIPEGFDPDEVITRFRDKYQIEGQLAEDDPRIEELLRLLAPINSALNDKVVKLAGYVVPLETDGRKSAEFLLVPYFGACIHVPPPPPNQIVYVVANADGGAEIRKLFDVVEVTGMMTAVNLSTDMADAGYKIVATKVEPYE